ncbi:T9SS type A sorting domain-containing protein [Flavobacterium okayamense]|uniref:Uncharacterized protein n=1 Tax=Flavobacterium okayamense TaxID=2830782 RepID=A0ABM7S788_9FLAO|nr:T9SS type A sorting domain-containing protein [Flavobacterium okayamense]BCY29238.1 hypothetical protein KK2020170_21060 [Flavobacterium okayamense]
MKKLYFLLFLVFSFLTNAQIVNIPDANFKAKLLSSNPGNISSTQTPSSTGSVTSYHVIDTNGDGEIQYSEASLIKYLSVQNSSIADLTGIEAFINLEYLNCSNNSLNNLNLLSNVNLKFIYCNINNLTQLNTSNLTQLKTLVCHINNITSLDFTNNNLLEKIDCFNNNLSSLNVSNLINLDYLDCSANNISNLNLTNNTLLKTLRFRGLSNIDLTNNTLLEGLTITYSGITSLDLSQNPNLIHFYVRSTFLEEINLENNYNVMNVDCAGNQYLKNLNLKNGRPGAFSSLNINTCPNLNFICCDYEDISYIQQKIDLAGYTNCHTNSYCTFTPGGTFYEVNGNNRFDYNNDGCSLSDIIYPNLKFNITNGSTIGSFISNISGNYKFYMQAGNHTITPVIENPSYFSISPQSYTVNFPTQASPFTQDFCVTANGVHSNIEIVLVPITPARPGFDAQYRIIYKNIGNQVENGEVTFAYQEDVLDFISSSSPSNSQSTSFNTTTLSWNYTNLLPFETRIIDVVLNVNSPTETPAVNNGDVLGIFSEISTTNTDEDLSNNSSSLRQIVVGSYDPNDKTCVEGESVDISMVGEYVHYVIRFENTGTYSAENIVVKDMIDTSKFDLSTLVPLHGSHEFYTRIKDNKVEFIFENINLDFNDATNDGYVAFKIRTLPTLTVGDTFSNDANIYFDYNFPITTNEYVTTINNLLSNQDFPFENEFVLYPNPTKKTLNISTKNQAEIKSAEVYNMVGQIVIAIPNSTKTIDISNLEAGTYFVKVNTQKGSATTKFVKE